MKSLIIIISVLLLSSCAPDFPTFDFNIDLSYDSEFAELSPESYNLPTPASYTIAQIYDANKTWIADLLMCWAAAAANLAAQYLISDETNIFNRFKDSFEDKARDISTGLVAMELGHLIRTEFDPANFMKFIKFCISNDRPVGVVLKKPDGFHDITIFGYDGNTLYVVDSDDQFFGLSAHSVNNNILSGYKYEISHCISLVADKEVTP